MLRLVVAHNGQHPVYLVTTVLSQRELSDTQVIEMYAKRWGIELFYRHLKQTFQRRKLLLAFRRTLRDYLHSTERGSRLCERLRQAIIDPCFRKLKASRNYPRKKQERAPGPPLILTASRTQIQRAKAIAIECPKRLTA